MNWLRIVKDARFIWICLGVISIIIRAVASPEQIEHFYSRGLFIYIRKAFDVITNLLPFALVYILFFILVFWLIKTIRKALTSSKHWKSRLFNFCYSTLAFVFGVIFLFLILWGYNYGRVPLEEQLKIDPKPLGLEDLKYELDTTTTILMTLRNQIPNVSDSAITKEFLPQNLEKLVRQNLTDVLAENNFPIPSQVRGRLLFPKGLLLRISTAGVYIPFTAEGHIDAGLHPLQIPFVTAHEMSHGYGFGYEGTCNFLAFLACINSEDPLIKYIGVLSYWRYVASNYRRYQPEEYSEFFKNTLGEGVKNDLRAIYAEMDKYPDILPKFRDAIYNNYLKAQGIEEGIKNYSRILMLVKAWKNKNGELSLEK